MIPTETALLTECRTAPAAPAMSIASSVNWILAADSAERAPLDRWCAGVGPVVTLAADRRDSAGVHSLAVITWNTHVGGGDIPGLVDDLRTGKFTDGAPVEHFVLLLQEVYRADGSVPLTAHAARPKRIEIVPQRGERTDIVQTARALGLDLYYVPSMSNGQHLTSKIWEDRGNAILSSLPLRDLTAIELPYEGQRRVATAATVSGTTASGEPWSVRLVNVHFDNRSRNNRFFRSLGAGRTRQARALVKVIGDDSTTVLGGDLNTWSAGFLEGAVNVLRERFPIPHESPTLPTLAVKWGIGAMRLDRLMFRLPTRHTAEARRLDDPRGSDHYPLLGWIRFAQPQVTENSAPAPRPTS